jgi:hypothetical protein
VELSSAAGRISHVLAATAAGRSHRIASVTADYQAGRYQPDAQATSHGLVSEALAGAVD